MQNEYIDNDNFLEENLKSCAITATKDNDLKTLLSGMKVANLKQLAQSLEISNRSKMKKDELVEAIFNAMKNSSELLKRTLLVCEEDEYELLTNLANNNEVEFEPLFIMMYANLIENGYIFILKDKKNYTVAMSNQIKELILQVIDKSLEKERELYQSVCSYISACINLYGIISIEKALEIYNHYNSSLELDKFNCIITELLSQERFFVKEENYLMHEALLEENLKEDLLKRQEQVLTYYLPTKETFIQYSDELYFEKIPQLYTLEAYISQNVKLKDIEVSDVVDEVANLAMSESTTQEIFNAFEMMGVEFSGEEQVKKVGELVADIIVNTRLWATKGFTTKEVYAQMETKNFNLDEISYTEPAKEIKSERTLDIKHYTSPIRVMKIGRNDPCPCGSGKKYKKCCLGK